MITYDEYTVDAAGIFLTQQLTKYDWTTNDPLYSVTWDRDVRRRTDVTIVDDYAAYTLSNFAHVGGINPGGKNWTGKQSTAVPGPAVDIAPVINPVHQWASLPSWSMRELYQSQFLNRPIDTAKLDVVRQKFEMDSDEQVYIGDGEVACTGLLNDPRVVVTNAAFTFAAGTPDQVLAVLNTALSAVQTATGYALAPTKIILPFTRLNTLISRRLGDNVGMSILTYLEENNISAKTNGRPLEIVGTKWADTAGVGGVTRMCVYYDDKRFVQFPRVELMQLPVQPRGFDQILPVMGALGVVEVRYPETMLYVDGV
jgi:hypothetical protein